MRGCPNLPRDPTEQSLQNQQFNSSTVILHLTTPSLASPHHLGQKTATLLAYRTFVDRQKVLLVKGDRKHHQAIETWSKIPRRAG